MFHTQGEAKRFFVEKVLRQASFESATLSEAEQGMLTWSETDPELALTANEADALIRALESQMSDDKYELKIGSLLKRAYDRDLASDPGMKEIWKDAYSKLNEGDHYIAVMLEASLGRNLRKGWFS